MSDDPASKDGLRWEIRRSLVERLRIPWEGMGDMANQQRAEAAVQISTMMDEIEELRGMLKVANEMAEHYAQERDEARREVCKLKSWNVQERLGPEGYALLRKWDCFARHTSEHL